MYQGHTAKLIFAKEPGILIIISPIKPKFHILGQFLILVQNTLVDIFQQSPAMITVLFVQLAILIFHIRRILRYTELSNIQVLFLITERILIAIS